MADRNATPKTPPTFRGATRKTPSCVVCNRRKVKCDRQDPCSACTRNGVECIYRAHFPPRRRKRQRSDGAHPSPLRQDPGPAGSRGRHGMLSPTITPNASVTSAQADPGLLIAGGGKSVYVDGNMWSSIRAELPSAEDVLRDASVYSDSSEPLPEMDDESSLILGSKTKKKITELHPEALHIFKLWQVFLENVNPLIKILHGPTVQQQIIDATGDLGAVPRGLEALMFCVYCISLISMTSQDVQKAFGHSKTALLSRFRRGARLALSNAGILRTSDIVVLQAFVLYLFSMRAFSDPQSIWSLCGVAIRLAQRIGLHRDGSLHGLSVFETEMRRRLWLQLSILDATTAQLTGITSQTSLMAADVRRPANVNDCDLDPRMTDSPREHSGATEMIFCLARCEFGEWLTRWSKLSGTFPTSQGFLSISTVSLAEKDRAIDELSHIFDTKYLKYCDASIPLHQMTKIVIHSIVSLLRFSAHHPRHDAEMGGHKSQAERDQVFSICLRLAEGCDIIQTSDITQRYMWHVENHIPWTPLIHMLYELRYRVDGEEPDRAWLFIDRICSRHFHDVKGQRQRTAFSVALQNLLMKSWKAHAAERAHRNRPPLTCPTIVSIIWDMRSRQQTASYNENPINSQQEVTVDNGDQSQNQLDGVVMPHGLGAFDLDQNSSDLSPMDWNQWDQLLEDFQHQCTNEGEPHLNLA
ncbi:transcription factor domain protein [Aspergillus homomorphus CBS 101889]|uniref:Fungal-specific transcription factor domain protein n=1 Tax=Aspergillus homomorphus (strain CBS 101889) TaxID=1450537 RepID=A0A395HZC5_ASPHC|nr:fungal-specific transcription factor domain protein [Aspergillus homomorphus CBS 101889]RAL12218.1 fungal-specific transcription factor domain protein [Aspergillus homomorphus CBS 101889]